MKKMIFLTLLATPLLTRAQNPVVNGGFENWTSGEPDGWTTSNIPGFATTISQGTPPHGGMYAARGEVAVSTVGNITPVLTSTDSVGNGFPVSQAYGNLQFYYKFTQSGNTFFYAAATLLDSTGAGVAVAYFTATASVSSWTLASVPVVYTGGAPKSGVILFSTADTSSITPVAGNMFFVDDVALTGTVGMPEADPRPGIERLAPNPAQDAVALYYSATTFDDLAVGIYDLRGNRVKSFVIPGEVPGRHKADLDVATLPAGMYLVRLAAAGTVSYSKLAVVR